MLELVMTHGRIERAARGVVIWQTIEFGRGPPPLGLFLLVVILARTGALYDGSASHWVDISVEESFAVTKGSSGKSSNHGMPPRPTATGSSPASNYPSQDWCFVREIGFKSGWLSVER
ncbi:hypothetical protein B0H16DRAFT_1470005 [Mycena metata]|uniref:Uncharacterized protein n=1 Tax=Mycena metata TaxID=1033252 RepID=A0AAD7MT32_9AGAR|nr:hypothetical protein B0H16DRAFT_1470005 [Mycena metata]